MLTFCVCYKNGCNDYTDVNILRNRMPQKWSSGYTDENILRMRMLQEWMQWLHGC